MNCNANNIRRLVQVAEEAHPPVHVPLVLGNEVFIVTTQDVRKIEDTRMITYNKLMPNGELIPMERLGHDNQIRDAILNACKLRMHFEQNASTSDSQALLEHIARMCSGQMAPQPMDAEPNFFGQMLGQQQQSNQSFGCPQTTATLEQQMQWERAGQSCPPTLFPMHFTTSTSTTELTSDNRADSVCTGCGTGGSSRSPAPTIATRNYGSNTVTGGETPQQTSPVGGKGGSQSARAQLKQKKEKHVCFME